MTDKIAAIVPAAGESRRMGCCKQLLPLGVRTVIEQCLATLINACIEGIIVVTGGGYARQVEAVVRPLPVTVVRNPLDGSDMAESLRIGLAALSPDITVVLVFLPDHPLVTTATCRAIVDEHARSPNSIIIPTFEGRKGHPPLFPRRYLEELATLPTLRDIIRSHADDVNYLETADRGVILDMDSREDYERVREIFTMLQQARSKETPP